MMIRKFLALIVGPLLLGACSSSEFPSGQDLGTVDMMEADSESALDWGLDAAVDDAAPHWGTDSGADAGSCKSAALAGGSTDFILGVAGAPLALFGPAQAPTFGSAFTTLSAAGVNAFFPWFGVSEIDGVATVSPHFDYWLPGAGPRSCATFNPYAAAEGKLKVLFPAFFFSDAVGDAALNPAVFRQAYASYRDACWGGNDDNIAAFQTFDEYASQRVVNTFLNQPGPRLHNAVEAAALIHELSDKPVLMVEGPLPTVVENEAGLTPAQRTQLIGDFWAAVDAIVPGNDIYGFDVYPVPSLPLTLPADYIGFADQRAPNTERLAVLQGFSYDAETNGQDPRRGPNRSEARFMAFDALAHGARHLIWYGASALDVQVPAEQYIWTEVLDVVSLIDRLGPSFDRTAIQVVAPANTKAIARELDDGLLLVVMNRTDALMSGVQFSLPVAVDAIIDAESGQAVTQASGAQVLLDLQPWDVRVLLATRCR